MAKEMYSNILWGRGGIIFYYVFRAVERINCFLSDKIVVSFESTIKHIGLENYKDKVIIGNYNYYYVGEHFKVLNEWSLRQDIIGYVGRLSREKGIIELVEAIPLVLQLKKDASFLIVGDGPMKVEMEKQLKNAGCLERVNFVGWVTPYEVSEYLNQMKFNVIPSYTEAGGRTCLEAMACGAVVVANSVGGLLSMVNDDNTGFLLEDNQPQTIVNKLIDIWDYAELDEISKRAYAFVKQHFSYENAVASWKSVLNSL